MHFAPNNRRDFIKDLLNKTLILIGAPWIITACGGSSSDDYISPPNTGSSSGGNCLANGTSVNIQVTHLPNHALNVSIGDINAGVDKLYILENNGSGHTHSVTLTAADFANLKTNTTISHTSTLNFGHTHQVTISCL